MNVSKMQEVQPNVECKYKNRNTKKSGIHLSSLHIKRKARIFSEKAGETLYKIALAAIPTMAIGRWGIEAAYRERGYSAIGGEWLLIIATFVFSLNLISKHIDKKIRRERARERRERNFRDK